MPYQQQMSHRSQDDADLNFHRLSINTDRDPAELGASMTTGSRTRSRRGASARSASSAASNAYGSLKTTPYGDNAALFFSDVKFDDLAAIATVAKLHIYSKIVVVIEAVEDKQRAAFVLYHFLRAALGRDVPRIEVLRGTTPPTGTTGHEEPWKELEGYDGSNWIEDVGRKGALASALEGKHVDAFQIAPVNDADMEVLRRPKRFTLDLLHITHGSNTRRKDESDSDRLVYLQRLKEDFVQAGKFPDVIVTSKRDNMFSGGDGSTVKLSLLDGHFPPKHLAMALKDSFAPRQLRDAMKIIQKARPEWGNMMELVPREWEGQGGDFERATGAVSYSRAYPSTEQAKAIREHYLKQGALAHRVLTYLQSQGQGRMSDKDWGRIQVLLPRFAPGGGYPKTFKEDTNVELYDALHVLAVLRARSHDDLKPVKFEPGEKDISVVGTDEGDAHALMPRNVDQEQLVSWLHSLWPKRADFLLLGH